MDRRVIKPYLADYYNVKGYFYRHSHLMTSATARILNSTTEALNDNQRLPRFLIVAIDKDMINDLQDFEYGSTKNLESLIHWITRQIDITVR